MAESNTEVGLERVSRFYSPGVIAIYCILYLPMGLLLLGLNYIRRGHRANGGIYLALSGILAALYVAATAFETRLSPFLVVSAAAAAFVISTERAPFERAIQSGGAKARWWPPLLWLLGWLVVLVTVVTIFEESA